MIIYVGPRDELRTKKRKEKKNPFLLGSGGATWHPPPLKLRLCSRRLFTEKNEMSTFLFFSFFFLFDK